MSGLLLDDDEPCPMNKGEPHAIHLFHNGAGVSCRRCHKTWGFVGDELVPTFSNPIARAGGEKNDAASHQ